MPFGLAGTPVNGHSVRMVYGSHLVLFSSDPDGDRAFLTEVLGFEHVDAGGGWLILGLPPAELAVTSGGCSRRRAVLHV
jgi:hypothetical protein